MGLASWGPDCACFEVLMYDITEERNGRELYAGWGGEPRGEIQMTPARPDSVKMGSC